MGSKGTEAPPQQPRSALPPRFVLDVHLGRLARHLRMLGFDSLWHPDYTDPQLRELARSEGRVLLTRDRELHELTLRESVSYRVDATDPSLQLIEVCQKFHLLERVRSGQGFLTRCLQCNSPILPVRGDQISERIPAHILNEYQEFFLCPRCERVYWKGSHFDRMREWVRRTLFPS